MLTLRPWKSDTHRLKAFAQYISAVKGDDAEGVTMCRPPALKLQGAGHDAQKCPSSRHLVESLLLGSGRRVRPRCTR